MTHIKNIINTTEEKYQKTRYISSENMCPNNDLYIDLPYWKCVCSCFQILPQLYLTEE